jgi:hypothetical protein
VQGSKSRPKGPQRRRRHAALPRSMGCGPSRALVADRRNVLASDYRTFSLQWQPERAVGLQLPRVGIAHLPTVWFNEVEIPTKTRTHGPPSSPPPPDHHQMGGWLVLSATGRPKQ